MHLLSTIKQVNCIIAPNVGLSAPLEYLLHCETALVRLRLLKNIIINRS
jgi:hypothetical protein